MAVDRRLYSAAAPIRPHAATDMASRHHRPAPRSSERNPTLDTLDGRTGRKLHPHMSGAYFGKVLISLSLEGGAILLSGAFATQT